MADTLDKINVQENLNISKSWILLHKLKTKKRVINILFSFFSIKTSTRIKYQDLTTASQRTFETLNAK